MKHMFVVICLATMFVKSSEAAEVSTNILLRYESETNQINLAERKRIRLIASVGLTHQLNENWALIAEARTGLKNKQNVPAITLYQITDQSKPDNDVFVSKLYSQAKFDELEVYVGKIPWKTEQVTDVFWDRQLNPIGLHVDYTTNAGGKVSLATFKPLDGASDTVGHMSTLQYQIKLDTALGQLTIAPWLVDFRGQSAATYAIKDTNLDNQFVRLSVAMKAGTWQLGADVGRSVSNLPAMIPLEFSDQKLSYVFELKQGSLKNIGGYLTQLRYLYVERLSVVTEFAQNASSRFATSNFKGWDLRTRHKLNKYSWVGARLSKTRRLVGAVEQSVRFRIETKYSF